MAWTECSTLPFRDVEFSNYSQNGEDGILLYLFSLAGHGHRRAVEMCAGNGIENNTANLVLHHDWDALMVDGDSNTLERGRNFYHRQKETCRIGPLLAREWITAENVNRILEHHRFTDNVDLLSLDMDGIDYWILAAMKLAPRIIVLEYNNRIPADQTVTVPYRPDFTVAGSAFTGDGFFGASLGAFAKLLDGRGYRLVGANRQNTNAFFLRHDVLPEFVACSAGSCLTSRWARHQQATWPTIAARGWVEV